MPPPLPSPREADAFQGTTNRKCLSPFIHTTRLSKAIFSEPCPITAAVLRGPHSLTCQMLRKLGLCPRLVPSSALSSRGHWIQCSLSASYFLAPQVVSCNQWSPKQFITFLSCPPPHAPSCWWHYRFLCARAGSSWVSLDSLFSHSSSKLTAESCGMSFHDVTWICLLLLATVPLPSGLAFLPSLGGSGGGGGGILLHPLFTHLPTGLSLFNHIPDLTPLLSCWIWTAFVFEVTTSFPTSRVQAKLTKHCFRAWLFSFSFELQWSYRRW